MEAFLSVSRKELQKRVLLQYDFRQSKVTRFALILYLLSFLACEIPLLATDCECTNDLPDYLYILRLVFVAIAFTILIISKPEPNSYRIYEDVLKVVVFTGILFTTSYNFRESQESRSKFYGVNPFWEGVDISFYLLIVSVFIIRNWWFRSIFIAINFIIAVVAKNINERDLYYIIKLAGILAACALLMHSLERDFRLLYLRKLHYKQEEQAWRRLIDTLPEGVMVINTAKEVMFYNKGIADFVPIGNEKKSLETQLSKVMQEVHQLKCRDQVPNADFEFLTTNIDSKGNGHPETVPLTLSSKAMALGTKMNSVHDEREETTYSYTLWTQVSFFLQNYQECKTRNIGWNSDKGETSFITFEGRYQDRVLEIKIAFTPFDYQECIIIVLRDTSDRNTIALLEANDKYKSLVLASVSHELRTPLSNTFNMVTFASESEGTTTEVKNQFLQPALISLKMLLGLVNDILDYSQINENKFRLVYQDVDIPKVLEETSNLMKLQAAKKGIQLFTEIEDDIPNPFHTDPNRLTQIMLNLLSNALKFTLNGYIKISAKIQDYNYDLIEISVEDTGIGMSVEDQAQLFQNYTKIEIQEKAKLNASGCGLGLAISNTLAKALARGEEDSIKVSSELGKGSKFVFLVQNKANEFSEKKKLKTFNELKSPATKHQKMLMNKFSEQTQRRSEDFIPLQVDEKDYSKKRSDHHALAKSIVEFYRTNLDVSNPGADIRSPGISKPKRKKSSFELPEILIVDDDSFNILSLETILKALGYTFTHAYNGKQAIEKIIERSNNRTGEGFKLVFMDCNMPIMDGFEATQELRAKMANGEISHIPIIGCTAYNHEETIQQCHENQMDGVICKPASKAKVAEILERFIVKDL